MPPRGHREVTGKYSSIDKATQKEFKDIWSNLLMNHIKAYSSKLGQPLDDGASDEDSSPGQTTLMDLLAIDMSAIKYTIGGAPYNAAKISATEDYVVQGDVRKKNLEQWEAETFELLVSESDESIAKEQALSNLLSCKIIVPTAVVRLDKLSSSRNLTTWKKSIRAVGADLTTTISI